MFGEISSALSVGERLWKWLTQWRKSSNLAVESVAARFIRLFESHGVHRNQIPRFFKHELTLADVQSDESLLPKLTEGVLDAACKLFAVRREWLDGAENQVHPTHDFYKSPEQFAEFLDALIWEHPEVRIHGRLLVPEGEGDHAWALMILEEPIGYVGDKEICRFHLCDNWLWDYWKARAYLTACIAIAWKRKICIHGVYKPISVIKQYHEGRTLLGWNGEGVYSFRGRRMYPEDMTFNPELYLKDVNPERENFGNKSALGLWLELEAQGLMDAGLPYDMASAREQFEKKREYFNDES